MKRLSAIFICFALVLSLVCILGLAACSGDAEPAKSVEPAEPEPAVQTEPAPAAEPAPAPAEEPGENILYMKAPGATLYVRVTGVSGNRLSLTLVSVGVPADSTTEEVPAPGLTLEIGDPSALDGIAPEDLKEGMLLAVSFDDEGNISIISASEEFIPEAAEPAPAEEEPAAEQPAGGGKTGGGKKPSGSSGGGTGGGSNETEPMPFG